MELTAVVLGCESDEDRFSAARNLLDFGFDGYERVTPHPDIAELTEIPVEGGIKGGADTRFTDVPELILPKGSGGRIKYHYSRAGKISAPVEKGQILGFVTMEIGGEVIGNAKIVAAEAVPELDFARCVSYLLKEFFSF